jgi:hypothetical protein
MTATNPSEQTALAVMPGAYDLSPRNFEEAWRMAEYLADSDMVPKDFKGKPANCLIAIQWGAELGIKTMQAIQNIAVINGRPSLWGDVMLALVRNSPLCEYVVEDIAGEVARCRVKRRGEPEQSREFTKADAEKAALWGKAGPWQQYPKRMLQMRARAWALRDVFTDVLKGLSMAEEALDMPPEKQMGPADVVGAPPPPATPAKKAYPQAEFDADKAAWQKAINKGKTPKDIFEAIALRRPEYELSEQQKAVVNSMKKEVIENGAPTDVTPKGEGLGEKTVESKIDAANTRDELDEAGNDIQLVQDTDARCRLQARWEARGAELEGSN